MDRTKQLAEENIPKLLLRFSVPAVIGMLVNALYNVVDRIFVGHGVGALGIAGITIGFPVAIITMAFAMLIGFGATSLISIKLGENKKAEAEGIMGNAFVLLILIALLTTFVGLVLLEPMLILFGASDTVLPYACDYMRIIILGSIFMFIGFGMNNFIRAEGNPKMAMYTMIIGAVLNTIGDPIFIFVFDLGIRGAAYSTVLSQMVTAVWVMYYFYSGQSSLKLRRVNLRLQLATVKRIFAIGSASFAMQLAASLLNAVMNNGLNTYGGDVAVAGMGIINSIVTLMLMPVFGINQGAQPIIGFNFGAQNYRRVKDTLKLAIIVATVIITIGYVLAMLFPSTLIAMFNNKDQELINFGVHAIYITFLVLPVIGIQIVGSSYFQAVGKPKQAMFLGLTRQLLILVPLLIILPRFYGLDGVLYALPISDMVSAVITVIWLSMEMRNLKPQAKPATVEGQR